MKGIWIASLLASVALSAGFAIADDVQPSGYHGGPGMRGGPGMHPCIKLRRAAMEACQSAKYVKGGHKDHMGLYEDCLRPIMEGKEMPANVTVDKDLVAECQSKRMARRHGMPGGHRAPPVSN